MIDALNTPNDYLLTLFLRDVTDRLRAEARAAVLAACEAEIEKSVKDAVESLQASLTTSYDLATRDTIVRLVIKRGAGGDP